MKAFGGVVITSVFCLMLAASAGAEWVTSDVSGVEGRVIGIAADTYTIDVGVSKGAAAGKKFLVYDHGGFALDANNVAVGEYRIPLAVLNVDDVATSESFCSVAHPSKDWLIQRGDGVMLVSDAFAGKLKFAAYRALPDSPDASYSGRWTRAPGAVNPVNVIVKYYNSVAAPQILQGSLYPEYAGVPPYSPVQGGPAPYVDFSYIPPVSYERPLNPPQPLYPPVFPRYLTPPDFDVNVIADARLIRTFPLTQVEVYSLEIRHREAWSHYENKRYKEALEAFVILAQDYMGNYLSPYWAGKAAQKLGNREAAATWFNAALKINPYYQPARTALDQLLNERSKTKRK
jgi:hypothetical protein